MKEKLLKALAVLPGTLIVLAVLALPWVTFRIALQGYPNRLFPYLPFTNGLVRELSGTLILFELFLGLVALIVTGVALTQVGLEWYGNRGRRIQPES